MPAHSRPKDGVLSHAYVAGIHVFGQCKKEDVGGRDKRGHDDYDSMGGDKPGRDSVWIKSGGNQGSSMLRLISVFLFVASFAVPASAAQCGGDFQAFLAAMARDTQAAGVSRAVIDQAFAGVTSDPAVLSFDRRQRGTFRKTFEEYAATRVGAARVKRARAMMQKHAALLSRVEQRFGVPRELIVAIWTMETDNGADQGKLPVVRTLATLAHDCRRTDLFQ